MGQAFDRDGNVLGEAFGATKREVFDKLMQEHQGAHEIRIRSLERQAEGASAEMPLYRCHKEVWALKIGRIDVIEDGGTNHALITPVELGYSPFYVGVDYVKKHDPKVGGYYVVYKDGYKSFSPAEAFEDGYTRKEPT